MSDPSGPTPEGLRAQAQAKEDQANELVKSAQRPYDPNADPRTQYPNPFDHTGEYVQHLRREAAELRLEADRVAKENADKLVFDSPEPLDEGLDTGHYDDGHAFGWKQPDTAALSADAPLDTGHYDDGHTFGWQKPAEPAPADEDAGKVIDPGPEHGLFIDGLGALASRQEGPTPAKATGTEGGFGVGAPGGIHQASTGLSAVLGSYLRQRNAQIALVVVVLAGVFLGTQMLRGPVQQNQQLQAPTAAPTAAASVVAAQTARASTGPIVTCTLVTTAEAGTILNGATVTAQDTTPPGPQCRYVPSQRVVWSFQEPSRVAQIRLDNIVLTVSTGAQAASQYAAKQATFGKNTDDTQISGLGDKAIYTGGQQLSVLRGSSYVNVSAQVDYDWGDGNTRYEDVYQKYVSILTAFAKAALGRMP